jgi:hypothetical protein
MLKNNEIPGAWSNLPYSVIRYDVGFLRDLYELDKFEIDKTKAKELLRSNLHGANRIKYYPYRTPKKYVIPFYSMETKKFSEHTINIDVDSIPKIHNSRESLLLPSYDSKIMDLAKYCAKKINQYFKRNKQSRISFEYFKPIFEQFASNQIQNLDLTERKSLLDLTVFLCLKSKNNESGSLDILPRNFLDLQSPDICSRTQNLIRYVFSQQYDIKTIADLENSKNLRSKLIQSGLSKIVSSLDLWRILILAYPGWTLQDSPLIKYYKINSTYKWVSDFCNDESRDYVPEPVLWTTRQIFMEQDPIDSEGFFDIEKIKRINWSKLLYSKDYKDCRNIFISVPNVSCVYEFLITAAPNLFGIKPGQIPVWELNMEMSWGDKTTEKPRAHEYIKQMTRFIVAKLGLFDENQKPILAKFRSLSGLHDLFCFLKDKCLSKESSGITSDYDAFRLTYPEKTGWGPDQISPDEIRGVPFWVKDDGEFKLKMIFSRRLFELFEKLKQNQIPGFQKRNVTYDPLMSQPLAIKKDDIKELTSWMYKKFLSWEKIFVFFGILEGYRKITSENIEKFFDIVFGSKSKSGKYSKYDFKFSDLLLKSHPTKDSLGVLLQGLYDINLHQLNISALDLEKIKKEFSPDFFKKLNNLVTMEIPSNRDSVLEKLLARVLFSLKSKSQENFSLKDCKSLFRLFSQIIPFTNLNQNLAEICTDFLSKINSGNIKKVCDRLMEQLRIEPSDSQSNIANIFNSLLEDLVSRFSFNSLRSHSWS